MLPLIVIIPVYNEEDCIKSVALDWLSIVNKVGGKLILINDGSKDQTEKILNEIALEHSAVQVIHQINAGHGAAILNGYRTALAQNPVHIFQTDSDDQFESKDFWTLWELRDSSPFLLGVRTKRQDPLHRIIISKILRTVLWLSFGAYVQDPNSPFRLMKAKALSRLLTIIPEQVFAPNIFLSLIAQKIYSQFKEIPVHHKNRNTGQVSIVKLKLIKVCFRSLGEIIRFRVQLKAIKNESQSI